MMEHIIKIGEQLYTTDWRHEDLYKFWSLTMDDDIVKGINDGAHMMKCSVPAVVPVKPLEVKFSRPNVRQLTLPGIDSKGV